jgi:hypothetical protein
MVTRRFVVACAVLTAALSAMPFRFSAVGAAPQNASSQGSAQSPSPNMQNMMKMHEQMMAEMKTADAKLDALVKDMNAATGDAKVTALAVVVNELVQQHKAMHGHMSHMHQEMMGGRGMMMRK